MSPQDNPPFSLAVMVIVGVQLLKAVAHVSSRFSVNVIFAPRKAKFTRILWMEPVISPRDMVYLAV